MHRNTHNISRRTILTLYVGSGAVAGGVTGAVLGWLGSHLPTDASVAVASGLALVGLVGAIAGLSGRWRPPLQCDIETPKRWVFDGAIRWPLKNGASLGFGGFTRLGFSLWYAIPLGALLSGTPAVGAALYAIYGTVRTGAAALIWVLGQRRGTVDPLIRSLERGHERWQAVTAIHLMALSMATLLVVGV